MRPVPIILAAIAVTAVTAGCSSEPATKAAPTVTVTAPTKAAVMSPADKASAQLACFAWTTYHAAQKAGYPDTKDAPTAQQAVAQMSDPRWSRIADLPAGEAMRVLGGLCAEIHYNE